MKMRTRILGRMLNSEVQQYLERNDIIIVPVGTTEMHGGMPLDCETVVSEAIGLKMAEACDALLLTGLPYFYAGATASGRGTVQVSVRQGIDYLGAIARSLLRQGFKRQIYISFHGPAHMTICPMLRDFYDETGVPILYMDMCMQLFNKSVDLFMMDKIQTDPVGVMKRMDSVFVAGYRIMGRLDDVPCTTEFSIRGSRAALPLTTCSVLPIKAVQSDIVSKKMGIMPPPVPFRTRKLVWKWQIWARKLSRLWCSE